MTSKWDEVTLESMKANSKNAFAMGPFGSNIKAENFTTVGVPVIKGGNLNGTYLDEIKFDYLTQEKADQLSSSKARRFDLVITHRGTLGQVGLIPENSKYIEYIVSQSQLKMSFDCSLVDPYFVYYFLKSPLGQSRLLANTSQVGVPAIAQALTTLKQLKIPLPTLSEQKKITELLRLLDDRISLLREHILTLEDFIQTLFKSWFVKFEPVHINQGRSLSEGPDKSTAELFPDHFDQSELGEIPKGWKVTKLKDFAKIKGGKMLEKKYFAPNGSYPVFGGAGEMGRSDFFNADGFVISVGRVGAYCGQYFWHEGKTWINNNASLIIPNQVDYSVWLYVWLRNVDMNILKKGAAQPFVSNTDIQDLKMILPSSLVIEKFVDISKPVFKRMSSISLTILNLSNLRDTILPRLILGELRLPDAENQVEEAA